MDFGAWQKLAAQSEEEALQREIQALTEADEKARQSLALAGADASRNVTSLSQVGSYGDYLKAKQAADKARAVVDARLRPDSALQGDVRARGRAAQRAGPEALATYERKLGVDLSTQQTEAAASKAAQEARAAAAKKAEEERADRDKQAREGYLAALLGGAKGRAGAGGTQRDYVGAYNPYADSKWAQQQGGYEAQMARNAGATSEQQRSIWDAYTAKGSMGSTGATGLRPNPYSGMEREMAPFAPKKKEED